MREDPAVAPWLSPWLHSPTRKRGRGGADDLREGRNHFGKAILYNKRALDGGGEREHRTSRKFTVAPSRDARARPYRRNSVDPGSGPSDNASLYTSCAGEGREEELAVATLPSGRYIYTLFRASERPYYVAARRDEAFLSLYGAVSCWRASWAVVAVFVRCRWRADLSSSFSLRKCRECTRQRTDGKRYFFLLELRAAAAIV